MESTKTETQTQTKITRRGDVITVKTTETITTTRPGKKPEVKVVEKEEKYEGEDGFKRLPEEFRKQLEEPSSSDKETKPINMKATKGDFVEECLKEHNKYREEHGVAPLKLSKELVEYSHERAKELAEKDELVKRKDHKYGENISCLWSSDPDHAVTASEVVKRWYSEGAKYDFKEEPKDLTAGHFTQVVWKATKEFGVAAVKSQANKIYVVATYSPSGNYVGEFKENVLPSKSTGDKKSAKTLLASAFTGKAKTQDSTSSSSSDDEEDALTKLNKESVKWHNEYRKKHGVPPLKHSKTLQKYAQEWADELARTNKFQHRSERKYGENLYTFYSSDPNAKATAADACKAWYDEIQYYTFGGEPKNNGKTGHFTQVVWKGTEEVGMGKAKSRTGQHIIVANYSPAGNYIGKYAENVPKPKK